VTLSLDIRWLWTSGGLEFGHQVTLSLDNMWHWVWTSGDLEFGQRATLKSLFRNIFRKNLSVIKALESVQQVSIQVTFEQSLNNHSWLDKAFIREHA